MPSCLRPALIGTTNVDYVLNDAGTAYVVPNTKARVLVPDTAITDVASCVAVSISGAEYIALTKATTGTPQTPNYPAWNELGSLSIADAQVISAYVGLLWAGVWGIKLVIKSLSIFERNQDE